MPRNPLRTLGRLFLGGMTALAALLPAERASAGFTTFPPPAVVEASASYRYANMTDVEAYAELDRRKVPYKKADPISGVLAPVRLTGKLHGVWIHSAIPESQRATSVYEVLDARLALAVDDFAKILERHDIEEVVHYSLYRPNVPREDHDVKEPARPAAAPVTDKPSSDLKGPASAAANGNKAPALPAATGNKAVPAPTGNKAVPAPTGNKAVPAPIGNKAVPAPTGNKAVPAPTGNKAVPAARPASPAAKGSTPASPKADAKGNKAAPAKSAPITGKAAPPPSRLPELPTKALPQPPSKGIPGVSGLKHKKVATAKPAPVVRARAASSPAPGAKPPSTTSAKSPAAAPALSTSKSQAATPALASAKSPALGAAKSPAATPAQAAAPKAPVAASRQTWASPGTRHPAGLAIDVALLKKRDGQWISVANDFHGRIGAKTCGDGVPTASTPEARELRSLVCESADLGVFTYVLTPNYNAAHYDHFHMEIRPATRWVLFH